MSEKSSMMAHADVFLTVYSTMVVETAIHGRPIVAACLDTPGGWNWPNKFSLPLSQIGEWPTHQRFLQSGSGRVAFDEDSLRQAVNHYLMKPSAERVERRQFIERECTFTDGSAGRRTGEFLLGILESQVKK
jgi:CDP-glycerol glycerophosphotransferase (TagB/SpsB family)